MVSLIDFVQTSEIDLMPCKNDSSLWRSEILEVLKRSNFGKFVNKVSHDGGMSKNATFA